MYVRLRSRRWVIDEDTLDLLSDDVVRGGESASGEALVEEPSSWGVEVEVGGVGNESASVGEKRGEGVDEKGERGGYGYERDDREQGVMGDEDEGDEDDHKSVSSWRRHKMKQTTSPATATSGDPGIDGSALRCSREGH